jgi:hypothetical protein
MTDLPDVKVEELLDDAAKTTPTADRSPWWESKLAIALLTTFLSIIVPGVVIQQENNQAAQRG